MCKTRCFVISSHIFDKLTLNEDVVTNAEKNTFSASWQQHLSHLELCMHKHEKTKSRQTIDGVVLKTEVTVELDDIMDKCVGSEWCHRWSRRSREAARLC